MNIFSKNKAPIKGSSEKKNTNKCQNCATLVCTRYYGKLHKILDDKIKYFYNISDEAPNMKYHSTLVSPKMPIVASNHLTSSKSSKGWPHIMMFSMNDKLYCYSCLQRERPLVYRKILLHFDPASYEDDEEDTTDSETEKSDDTDKYESVDATKDSDESTDADSEQSEFDNENSDNKQEDEDITEEEDGPEEYTEDSNDNEEEDINTQEIEDAADEEENDHEYDEEPDNEQEDEDETEEGDEE